MRIINSFLVIAFAASLCSSLTINISGFVTDSTGLGISGATVSLETAKITTTSGRDGSFVLNGNQSSIRQHFLPPMTVKPFAFISNGQLNINLNVQTFVILSVYSVQGRLISSVQKILDVGSNAISLPQAKSGLYLYKVNVGGGRIFV